MGEAPLPGPPQLRGEGELRGRTAEERLASPIRPAQKILRPLTERVRAFTQPHQETYTNKGDAPPAVTSDADKPAAELTDEELFARMTPRAGMNKADNYLRRVAEREFQQRTLTRLTQTVGKATAGAYIGQKIIFDTETTDIDRGQKVRFGVAQLRGLDYNEITDALSAPLPGPPQQVGREKARTLTYDDLNKLRVVYIFVNEKDFEIDELTYERSVHLLENIRAEREAISGVPHIIMEKDFFVRYVLFAPTFILRKEYTLTNDPPPATPSLVAEDNDDTEWDADDLDLAVSRPAPPVSAPSKKKPKVHVLEIPFPRLLIGHNIAYDLTRLPSHKASISRKKGMFGGFSLVMGSNKKHHPIFSNRTREERNADRAAATAEIEKIDIELQAVGGPPAKTYWTSGVPIKRLDDGYGYLSDYTVEQRQLRNRLLSERRRIFNQVLGNNPNGKAGLPRVQIKKIGPSKRRFSFSFRNNKLLDCFYILDTVQLAKALLGAGTPASMDALCEMWGSELPKEKVEHFKPLTKLYVEYALNDVERTWFIYHKLEELYLKHGILKPLWKILSEAGLGKAYYELVGIGTFLDNNIHGCKDPEHVRLMFELCGIAMEAMIGARTECGWRNEVIEGQSADFKSQYPTINILLHLQELLICNRLKVVEGDARGDDAKLLARITIDKGEYALLNSDRGLMLAIWPKLRGYALIDQTGCILPKRTVFDNADDDQYAETNSNVNVGLCDIHSGNKLWVSYLDILASKFLNGHMPTIYKTKRLEPDEKYGMQKNLKRILIFGDERYPIDLTAPEQDLFRSLIELRSTIKAERDQHPVGSPEYNRLEAMQLALKLLANSTSYGIMVQFDVDESAEERMMDVWHGDTKHTVPVRYKTTDPLSYQRRVSGIKAEKPGDWFAPWGPLITAGGRLLLAIVEVLAREDDGGKKYGGLHFGMCDTDSTFLIRPKGMPRDEFQAAFQRIAGKNSPLQRINPYNPTKLANGKEKVDAVFAIEDINFPFENPNGAFDVQDKSRLKPLYILSISAKRYAMANIVKEDGSDYDTIEEIHAAMRSSLPPQIILRKVSGHGLGHITAPKYSPAFSVELPHMAIVDGNAIVDRQPHLAVPYKYKNGALVYHDRKPIPLYNEVCKGKGNPRLFLDMWKLAFEQFLLYPGEVATADRIMSIIKTWKGLDAPQHMQRSLNTAQMWEVYQNIPDRSPECFFNVLPALVLIEGSFEQETDYDIDKYIGEAMYCSGGSDIDVHDLVSKDQVWWQKDGTSVRDILATGHFRFTEVRDRLGDYFGHNEAKSRGATLENIGKLHRHQLVILDREYVGKETNPLLEEDLAEDDETQIEDIATIPFLRIGINQSVKKLINSLPDFFDQIGINKRDLNKIMNGRREGRTPVAMAFIRKVTRYDEGTGELTIDPTLFRRRVEYEIRGSNLANMLHAVFEKQCAYHEEMGWKRGQGAEARAYVDFIDVLFPIFSAAGIEPPSRGHMLSTYSIYYLVKTGTIAGTKLQVDLDELELTAGILMGASEREKRYADLAEHRDAERKVSMAENGRQARPDNEKRTAKILAKRNKNAENLILALARPFPAGPLDRPLFEPVSSTDLRPGWWARPAMVLLWLALLICYKPLWTALWKMVMATDRNISQHAVEQTIMEHFAENKVIENKVKVQAAERKRRQRERDKSCLSG